MNTYEKFALVVWIAGVVIFGAQALITFFNAIEGM